MPNFKSRLDDFMLSSQLLIENALSDIEIKTALSSFGYDDNKLMTGKRLYEEVVNLHNKQKKEYGEQIEATNDLNKSWEEIDKIYMKTLKIARVALQNNTKANTSMMINGVRKKSLSGWLEQANAFYSNIIDDKELINEMVQFGYSAEKFNFEYNLVKGLYEKNLKQKKEMGEAQEATEMRDKKIDELDKWIAEFKVIVKIALEDKRQKLEKLGIVAK